MADKKNSKTRKKIVEAACKLFSEHGLDSVSTRMIADLSGTHLGSLHYYFDDKEALYLEVFRMAIQSDNMIDLEQMVKKKPNMLATPEGQSELIYLGVKDYFKHCFVAGEEWKQRLILRELSQFSGVAEKLTEEIFKPKIERARKAFKILTQKDSLVESFLWTHIPSYVVSFCLLTKPTLDRSFDKEFVTELFSKLADMTAMMMILLLGLPLPQGIDTALFHPAID